jgi:hypothetical protein
MITARYGRHSFRDASPDNHEVALRSDQPLSQLLPSAESWLSDWV